MHSFGCDLAMMRHCTERTCNSPRAALCPYGPIDNLAHNPLSPPPFVRPQPNTGSPFGAIGAGIGWSFSGDKSLSNSPNALVHGLKTISSVFRYIGLTRFLTYFCYNFHFAPVIENHPITTHVAVPVIKISKVTSAHPRHPQPRVKGPAHPRPASTPHGTKTYYWNIWLSDRSRASHSFDLSTRRVLPVSRGRAQCRLRLWQAYVGMATRCRHKVYRIPGAVCARVLVPACHWFGRD